MTNVQNMFTDTFIACPADRISSGQISLGTNQPNGPQDHANPATYTQIRANRISASIPPDIDPSPLIPKFFHIRLPTAI